MNVFGENLKLSIITSAFVALAGADSLAAGSLPRVVLRRAKATNKTSARVLIFNWRRSGEVTDTLLAGRF
jgi:hypothetical protein